VAIRILPLMIVLLGSAFAADPDSMALASRLYATTKARDFAGYTRMLDSQCHPRSWTEGSFDLRADLMNQLGPGATMDVMLLADYQEMMRKRGAPPSQVIFTVQPSHIVIVRGSVPGVAGGDHVVLNLIVKSGNEWRVVDGDCVLPHPAANSTAIDTSSWAEYRNLKYGFGFKYPHGWRVREGSANGSAMINITSVGEGKSLMTIAVQENKNARRLSIESWFAEELNQVKGARQASGTLAIGGQDAVFMENTNTLGVRRDIFLPLRTTDILSVSYVRNPELDRTYSAVLTSFRLATATQ
jgi:hypothetical protein